MKITLACDFVELMQKTNLRQNASVFIHCKNVQMELVKHVQPK